MPDLETSRLHFRRFTPRDLHDLAAIRSDPDVMQYIGAERPESVTEVQAILNKILAHWDEHGFGRWAVIHKDDGVLIGWCGLSYLDKSGDVEIGYGLAKPYWGKGLASEAAAATITYGFERLGLAQIVAVVSPGNIASQRVLEKLGMKFVKIAHFYNADVAYYAISREGYLTRSRAQKA